ncbi:LytTR family two component transcriptional regulator [Hungatella effluvii]|uniref:Stage 0 sporulation protein A homolog n=1 Tax=Hungatella effluvii TaxID=1096246 RepID=A0A2V3YFX9_9FIRM|nr:LytTR family DNA-binding domain-containing protein [Hungatella effluvii]PXX51953.1 LytTR family two component transcriptional regulator [Hungatella effluvii]
MIRIGLIDDDLDHLRLMKSFLTQYEKEEKVNFSMKEFNDGLNFVEDYDGNLDVIFLDIEMPHMDGMTAAKKIREKDQALGIVFVTNMAQYAIHGYEVNAIDFIVKPVSYYVFTDKLNKAIRFSRLNMEKDFVIHTEDSIIKLTSSQIIYVEKDKNYLVFHTKQGVCRSRGTISELEQQLSREGFSECINGCLVNLKYVTKMEKDTVWVDEVPLPITRRRKKEFKEDFMKYLGGDF